MQKKSVENKMHSIDLPKRRKASMVRLITAFLVFMLQISFLIYALYSLNVFALSVYILFQLISSATTIRIVSNQINPSYKIAWIVLILSIPFLGLLFYIMWGRGRNPKTTKKRIAALSSMTVPLYKRSVDIEDLIMREYPSQNRVTRFLLESGFPLYNFTETEYYPLGDVFFSALMDEIKKAKRFIFLEFFIIAKGHMWTTMLNVLREKVSEGVEVRLIYDDFGCISTLPKNYYSILRQYGIKTVVFNPIKPFISNFYLNYRNHQKICIIDGNVALTGGVNIADEYINRVEAYGHWKDSGLLLRGEGVWSLTVMFLQMWDYASAKIYPSDCDFLKFKPTLDKGMLNPEKIKGYVQPFCDGPLNNPNNPAEFSYMQMINTARRYIYITTPYLILDNEMVTSLRLAAASGVDVRIITPGIPDKKYVFAVTRTFYGVLLKSGVKIYEYTPGFIHSKNVVCDDETAIVGTINMDFRSFYLHFENGVWMCGASALKDIKEDFINTLDMCKQITYHDWIKRPLYYRFIQAVLNVFAPML